MGQVLCQEKRQEKHRGTGRTVAHTHRGRESRGQDAPTHHSHSTTQTHHGQGRQDTGRTTGQGHSTTQKHSTQKKAQESTQEYIEVCYSSSVEHKGTDHTVTPNQLHLLPSERTWHKASEPALCPLLRAGGARHRRRYYPDPKCNAGRGRRGFFADKIKKFLTISLRKAGRRLGNGPETEN